MTMSKLYCEELRKVHQEIQFFNQKLSEAEKEQKNELVLEVVNRIIELAILARKEGLLALEEAVEHLEGDSGKTFLKNIIMLVVDGTEPEDIVQIGMIRLIKDGEIVGNYDYLVPFFDLFRVDAEMEQKKAKQCEALKKLVEEYEYDLL